MNLIDKVIRQASCYDSVLDIGCGPGLHLKKIEASRKVGIDVWPKEIDLARENCDPNTVFIEADLRELGLIYGPNSFECIIGIDIVEHFDKRYVLDELLPSCENIASHCVIFFVPTGIHVQTEDVRGLDNHFYQTHRSTWYPKDMEDKGYMVVHEPKYFRPQPNKERGAMICINMW